MKAYWPKNMNETAPMFTGAGPADVVYPDFFNEEDTAAWWADQLNEFYHKVPFDGLWLDKNSVKNRCNGTCFFEQASPSPLKHKIIYTPTGRDLETHSISLDATHKAQFEENKITELEAHSLYGTL